MQTLRFPTRTLAVLTFIGLLFLVAAVFILIHQGGGQAAVESAIPELLTRNFSFTAQGMSIIFWLSLIFLGGLMWVRATVRPEPLTEILVLSGAFGVIVIVSSLIAGPYVLKEWTGLVSQTFVIFIFSSAILIGLLALITREILRAMLK